MKSKKLRGEHLDKAIEDICKEYVYKDPKTSQISRSLIRIKLGINSRSTFVGKRGEIIDYYKDLQLKNAGLTKSGTKKRDSDKTIENLKEENLKLKKERDQAISDYAAILYGLKIRGIDADEIFEPVLNSRKR
ncbi:hypothetical protein [Marivirga harenae]|uniref:hypothetical protein n=1 Tax=Marivirga harenae TaxID=2010992 RepID=UPI0026E0C731|nr:hypothetical protein [Marivirga harenae]WKV11461.1 hypothetical protein Q3Y49_14740 [Marivirga harenae]